jgi:hypothetical protein
VGNLHLRFDEGRAGRATRVAFSPTLPPGHAASSGQNHSTNAIPQAAYTERLKRLVNSLAGYRSSRPSNPNPPVP